MINKKVRGERKSSWKRKEKNVKKPPNTWNVMSSLDGEDQDFE